MCVARLQAFLSIAWQQVSASACLPLPVHGSSREKSSRAECMLLTYWSQIPSWMQCRHNAWHCVLRGSQAFISWFLGGCQQDPAHHSGFHPPEDGSTHHKLFELFSRGKAFCSRSCNRILQNSNGHWPGLYYQHHAVIVFELYFPLGILLCALWPKSQMRQSAEF